MTCKILGLSVIAIGAVEQIVGAQVAGFLNVQYFHNELSMKLVYNSKLIGLDLT